MKSATSTSRKELESIAILLVARGVGGLEKRFSTLFKYLVHSPMENNNPKIDFFVSRSLINKLNSFYKVKSAQKLRLVAYGIPWSSKKLFLERLIRYLDYLVLGTKLIIKSIFYRGYDTTHFVSLSSLKFRHLIKKRSDVMSFVGSDQPEKCLENSYYIKAMRSIQVIDCLSSGIADMICSYNLIDERKIHVSPCSFLDYSKTRVRIKNRTVVFLGRFDENKGILLLLDSLSDLIKLDENLKILILGWGELTGTVKAAIQSIDLPERVKMDYTTDPCSILAESAIFLSLQQRENYPSQSLLEAMACGNAIVATDVGLTRKLVDETIGILIKPDKKELVSAIKILLDNWDSTLQMGLRSREKVLNFHNVEKYWDYISKIYRESFFDSY